VLIKLLALIIPLGLAGAVSPVLLTEQTVMLSSQGGRRSGIAFALGAIAVLTAFIVVLVLFGRSIKLPKTPHLDAQLDVVVGVLLLATATLLKLRRPAEKKEKPAKAEMKPAAAFSVGCFSMATNFTTLALMVPAAKEVAASQLEIPGRAAASIVLIALASIPAWLPLALTGLAPETASRILGRMNAVTSEHGKQIGHWLLVIVGAYFVVRGVVRLA
jgi:threonine/homoserine/homoserine lactone efflux protein